MVEQASALTLPHVSVVVGLLIAFFALLVNIRLKPYADDGLNFVSQISQLNLFFFLFVALLLKVNLDGEGGSNFFSFIVGIMSVVPIALPIFIKVWLKLFGNLEAKMVRAARGRCNVGAPMRLRHLLRGAHTTLPLMADMPPRRTARQITKDAAWI